jgi:hypothetical protein
MIGTLILIGYVVILAVGSYYESDQQRLAASISEQAKQQLSPVQYRFREDE